MLWQPCLQTDAVGCPAPVFSVIRSTALYDVLMPNFREPLSPQYVPWEEKKELAFFRWVGSGWAGLEWGRRGWFA